MKVSIFTILILGFALLLTSIFDTFLLFLYFHSIKIHFVRLVILFYLHYNFTYPSISFGFDSAHLDFFCTLSFIMINLPSSFCTLIIKLLFLLVKYLFQLSAFEFRLLIWSFIQLIIILFCLNLAGFASLTQH